MRRAPCDPVQVYDVVVAKPTRRGGARQLSTPVEDPCL
jgi:hypothetical protein